MKTFITARVLTAVAAFPLFASVPAFAKDLKGSIKVGMGKEAEYTAMAKISMDDAVNAALAKEPGKAVKAELEREDGYLVYKVKVVTPDNKKHDVIVDAGNKEILKAEK